MLYKFVSRIKSSYNRQNMEPTKLIGRCTPEEILSYRFSSYHNLFGSRAHLKKCLAQEQSSQTYRLERGALTIVVVYI